MQSASMTVLYIETSVQYCIWYNQVGAYWILKLRQIGTQGVHLRGSPFLGWSSRSGTREYLSLLAKIVPLSQATQAAWRVSTP